ncbi:MAG: hypothetical protein ACXVBE_08650, partial [Bdellovibrionota bacterium]
SPVQMEVYNFHPPCSTSDYAYFLKFQLPGVSQDKAMKLDFLLATLNAEQMAKIYSEVKKNYPTRGLPECMKNDLTIMYFFDEKNGEARFEPVDRTTERCDGMEVRRPVTSCVDVAEIYPAAP